MVSALILGDLNVLFLRSPLYTKKKRHHFFEQGITEPLTQLTQLAITCLPAAPTRIALYYAYGAEVPTFPLVEWCWQHNHAVYLPIVPKSPSKRLVFAPYTPSSLLHPNRYGILEPVVPTNLYLPAAAFNVIVLPMLGFNEQGYRLGMGQGYYDHTLASIATLMIPTRIGLAWSCQACTFAPKPWDIPCHTIVTERKIVFPA